MKTSADQIGSINAMGYFDDNFQVSNLGASLLLRAPSTAFRCRNTNYVQPRFMATTTNPVRATAQQLKAVAELSTCEVSDALIKLGSPNGGLIPDLEALSSGSDERTVGEAYTVKMVEQSDKSAPKPDGHFVDLAPEGSIMVISSPPTVKSASLGGLLALSAKVHGVKGAVVAGRVRDLGEIRSLPLPVYARGHSTLGQSPFTRPSAVQVPLEIEPLGPTSFPPTQVNPFDVILADTDGVVVIKPSELDVVVQKALEGREIDERCRKDLEAGKGVAETFKKHRGK